MTLGEKVRYLREVEGTLRGLERAMTQQEVVSCDSPMTKELRLRRRTYLRWKTARGGI